MRAGTKEIGGSATSALTPDDPRALPTARLLWAACAGDPPPDVGRVRAALDAGADVPWAARAAVAQRVGPLLWRALEAAGRPDDLVEAGDALHVDRVVRQTQSELVVPRALRLAMEPLLGAGLEPVLFKGPAVAARYPEPGLRAMDDIDVLLPGSQHDEAVRVLERGGWKVARTEHVHVYDTMLLHPDAPDVPLELHRGLSSWRNRSNTLTLETLWDRRVRTTCAGIDVFGLPVEEELVALAAHAGKPFHAFGRLMWTVDLAMVVRHAGGDLDWDRVSAFARSACCQTALAVGLRLAERLGVDVPAHITALPRGRLRSSALALVLDERWPVAVFDHVVRHRLRYALTDRAREQAVMALGEVTETGLRDAPRRLGALSAAGVRRWLQPGGTEGR